MMEAINIHKLIQKQLGLLSEKGQNVSWKECETRSTDTCRVDIVLDTTFSHVLVDQNKRQLHQDFLKIHAVYLPCIILKDDYPILVNV